MTNEEMAVKLTDHENRIKVNEHRVSDLEETTKRIESLTLSVQELAFSIKKMTEEQNTYKANQERITNKLLEIENAPTKEKAKIHDNIKDIIITMVISAIVGLLLGYLGFH